MLNIGCCGDDCNYCPRYLAAQSGSEARLKEVAAIWRIVGWRNTEEPPEKITCRGCATVKTCDLGIEDCAMEKGIDSCGKCPGYPCEKLLKIFENNKKEAEIFRLRLSAADLDLFEKAFFTKKNRLDKINRNK
jgi:hypothetical protein